MWKYFHGGFHVSLNDYKLSQVGLIEEVMEWELRDLGFRFQPLKYI